MTAEFDEVVASFRPRPLDTDPYPFLWIDAVTQKVRKAVRYGRSTVFPTVARISIATWAAGASPRR